MDEALERLVDTTPHSKPATHAGKSSGLSLLAQALPSSPVC